MAGALLYGVLGFVAGCLLMAVAWLVIDGKKNAGKKAIEKQRNEIMSSIGELSAEVNNLFSRTRLGTIDTASLKREVSARIERINTLLQSNQQFLDHFYMKYMEKLAAESIEAVVSTPPAGAAAVSAPAAARGADAPVAPVPVKPVEEEAEPAEVPPAFPPLAEKKEAPAEKEEAEKAAVPAAESAPEVSSERPTTRMPVIERTGTLPPFDMQDSDETFVVEKTQEFSRDELPWFAKKREEAPPAEPEEGKVATAEDAMPGEEVFFSEDEGVGPAVGTIDEVETAAPPIAPKPEMPKVPVQERVAPAPAAAPPKPAAPKEAAPPVIERPAAPRPAAPKEAAPPPVPRAQPEVTAPDLAEIREDGPPLLEGEGEDDLLTGDDVIKKMDNLFGFE